MIGDVMTTGFFTAIFYGAVWLVTLHVRTFETLFKGEKWRVVYFFFIAVSFIGSGMDVYLFNTAERDMIYMNFGAALLPLSLSVYFLCKIRRILNMRIFAMAALAAILTAKIASHYVKGEGVFMNIIIIIFASVLMAYLLPFCAVKPSAKKLLPLRLSFGYIIATLGVFVGGDISYLKAVEIDGRFGDYMTIGGNGVKDGLWLAGLMTMLLILSVFLAAEELERKKTKKGKAGFRGSISRIFSFLKIRRIFRLFSFVKSWYNRENGKSAFSKNHKFGIMQKHRIFIAINPPENIKKRLADFREKWPELPVRWVRPENLHITLAFLGYISDEELPEICGIVKEAARINDSFFINLNKVVYGPPKKIPPRMIWAEGEKSEELRKLQSNLENLFFNESANNFNNNKTNSFVLHITLGRIRQWDWNRIEPEELPAVNEEISLKFPVESIEIMESRLKKGGPEYMILESVKLGEIAE